MHWSAYETFSVISGVIMVIAALSPLLKVKDRVWSLVGGIVLVIYGFYVANQTSGTYYFPVQIFLIPFLAIGYLVVEMVRSSQQRIDNSHTGSTDGPEEDGR
jgi:uncharacterized membrane protein HdeD (DUF308 family)